MGVPTVPAHANFHRWCIYATIAAMPMKPIRPHIYGAGLVLELGSIALSSCASQQQMSAPASTPGSGAPAGANGPAEPKAPAPARAPAVVAVNADQPITEPMLDDLEDGNAAIVSADQRSGSWSSNKDKAGSTVDPDPGRPFTPTKGGANGSKYASRIHGQMAPSGETYVSMGFSFTAENQPYDLSSCKGVSFMAKRGKDSVDTIRFKLADVDTAKEGGICAKCYNDFGVDLGLQPTWKQYTLYFDKMNQAPGWGDPFDALVSSKVYRMAWEVHYPNYTYDIWVDDVRLVGCPSAP